MRFCDIGILLGVLGLLGCGTGSSDHLSSLRQSSNVPSSSAIAVPAQAAPGVYQRADRSIRQQPGNSNSAAVAGSRAGGSSRDGATNLPLANTLIETINALSGDGLPLNAPTKATDPTILFRVRGDDVMLFWRRSF